MEEQIKDAWGWLGREIAEFGFRWLVVVLLSGVFTVLGVLLFGRGYKKRIAALEARSAQASITQTIIFHGDINIDRQLRDAIEAKTVQGLKETINRLPQQPLGDGHTYAELPENTRIVTMADGTIRLALPVNLAVSVSAGVPTATAVLAVRNPDPDGDS